MHEPGMKSTDFHRLLGRTLTEGSKFLIELTEQTDISAGNDRKHGHDTGKSEQGQGTTRSGEVPRILRRGARLSLRLPLQPKRDN